MPLHIVNIGSSFAAGPGIPPQVDVPAARSGENYAHIVARRLEAKLTDLSVSGATLLNLLKEPQVEPEKTFAPQIGEIPEDADVVLVLGGGNDIGYVGGMFVDSFNAYWIYRAITWAYGCFGWVPYEVPSLTTEELAERYGTVLDSVHGRVPSAKVVVVEYLSMLGPDLEPGIDLPFDAALLDKHKGKAEQLRRATVKAVQGRESWCIRVPVTAVSTSHGLGSQEPWINGFGLKELYRQDAYHPNARGMIAVAELVMEKLKELGFT
ncbi:hypothetical protein JX265_003130 [Neoarthrinium moseri]|uniref:SGNH hydrolase-type esterase domain-containing protein n=1 Tax=Neoarthrinium moseri TaxID=1658444 RepID=A0A9Q0ASK2_9PEZI|nr:hypothetical protein JX266_002183 [Neoarthrinium moseri]KAI1878953.1 hypothetical protein JX265_003130 [Neoarthrinium moseri]